MKITTKGRYGLRALVVLAADGDQEPVMLSSIAKKQNISLNYLEQVFSLLKKDGIVDRLKGKNKGYVLSRPANQITIKEILECLEGKFAIVDYDVLEKKDPLQEAICECVWKKIDERMNIFLENRTLDQMVNEYRKTLESNS